MQGSFCICDQPMRDDVTLQYHPSLAGPIYIKWSIVMTIMPCKTIAICITYQIQLETILALWEGNPPVTGGFPSQWASNTDPWFLFVVGLNKLLNKLTATSHYLIKCWPRSMPPYDITRPQWVNRPNINLQLPSLYHQISSPAKHTIGPLRHSIKITTMHGI